MGSHHVVKVIAAVVVLVSLADRSQSCLAQQAGQMERSGTQIQPLSRASLEALVAPYALYPDSIVERIFDSAQYPSLIHEAAHSGSAKPHTNWPASVQWVAGQPSLLKQLDADIALTSRLGIAARQQLEATWRAVDSVRQRMQAVAAESTQDEVPADETAQGSGSGSGAVAPVVPYSGAVAAALWTEAVVHELYDYRHAYYASQPTTQTTTTTTPYGSATTTTTTQTSPSGNATATTGSGSATVTGPAGTTVTAQGQATGGSATVGNTTYYGAAGSGTVTGSGGNSAEVAGQVNGSVTQNSDGSMSFQQSAQGSVNGSRGSGSISHSSSGTVTGDGNGNYQGNTSVQTQQGSLSTSTTAGNGQVTTTVDGPNGSNSYTAGDGQVGSSSQSARQSGSQRESSFGRPQSIPGDARFQQFGQQFGQRFGNQGARSADRSLRSTSSAFGRPQSLRAASPDARAAGSFGRPGSVRPNQALNALNRSSSPRTSRSRSSLNRSPSRSKPSRSKPSRSGGGRRGRR